MFKKNNFILKCQLPFCPNHTVFEIVVGPLRLALCADCLKKLYNEIGEYLQEVAKTQAKAKEGSKAKNNIKAESEDIKADKKINAVGKVAKDQAKVKEGTKAKNNSEN